MLPGDPRSVIPSEVEESILKSNINYLILQNYETNSHPVSYDADHIHLCNRSSRLCSRINNRICINAEKRSQEES